MKTAMRVARIAETYLTVGLVLVSVYLICPPYRLAAQGRLLALEKDVYIRSLPSPPAPEWYGRLLLAIDNRMAKQVQVDSIDGNGVNEQIPFEIPGGTQMTVLGIGAGEDRTVVLSGIAFSGDSRGSGFVAWIAPNRKSQVVVRTEKFFGYAVTAAADGAIWVAGQEWQDDDGKVVKHNVFRRYSSTGQLLGGFSEPRARAKAFVSGDGTQASKLMSSSDKVGWFTNGGEYFEFSLLGAPMGRFDGPPGTVWGRTYAGSALSEGGELIVGVRGDQGTQIFELERGNGTWAIVSLPSGAPLRNHVFGFDGDALILQSQQGELHRYGFASQAAQQ